MRRSCYLVLYVLHTTMALTNPALEKASQYLVTASNPARGDLDGMDSHRCAVLHNTIYEHGWTSSFGNTSDFLAHTQTWWEAFADPEVDARDMHPSVKDFLKEARVLRDMAGRNQNFYYFMSGLSDMKLLDGKNDWYDIAHPRRLITLFETYFSFAEHLDGLLCVLMSPSAL